MGSVRWTIQNRTGDAYSNAYKPRFSRNIVIRRNLFEAGYTPGSSKTPTIYLYGCAGPNLTDNVFVHCTWKRDALGRYVGPSTGGATPFRHDAYLSGPSQYPAVCERNLSIDPATTHLSNRNSAEGRNNVIIDAPIGMISAGNVTDGLTIEQPNGNFFDYSHNFFMGSSPLEGPLLTITSQPASGSTRLRLGGTDGGLFMYVASGQTPAAGYAPITIGSDLDATFANTIAALNASADPYVAQVAWSRHGSDIIQTPREPENALVNVEVDGAGVSTNDPSFRSWAYAMVNGVDGSSVHDSLMVNSGFAQHSGGFQFTERAVAAQATPGRTNGQSYLAVKNLKTLGWSTTRVTAQAGTPIAQLTFTEENVTYDPTSPFTNRQVYQRLGYANKTAFVAAVLAAPHEPWALRVLEAAGSMFGFDFAVNVPAAPVLVPQPASTDEPRVEDVVTFPDPTLPAGAVIVAATTYVNVHPIAGTGKGQNTITLDSSHLGKRLSRMVVARYPSGRTATVITEISAPVAAKQVAAGSYRKFEFTSKGPIGGPGQLSGCPEIVFKNDATVIPPVGVTVTGTVSLSDSPVSRVCDGSTAVSYRTAPNVNPIIEMDWGTNISVNNLDFYACPENAVWSWAGVVIRAQADGSSAWVTLANVGEVNGYDGGSPLASSGKTNIVLNAA